MKRGFGWDVIPLLWYLVRSKVYRRMMSCAEKEPLETYEMRPRGNSCNLRTSVMKQTLTCVHISISGTALQVGTDIAGKPHRSVRRSKNQGD